MAADILRLKYKRGQPVKYVSHLDFVKVFERALRRASVEVAFSGGYNPRMLLVFGNPLPVGYTSDHELCDITLKRPYEPEELVSALNSTLPGDISVISAEPLVKPYPSILSSVSFAEYVCRAEGLGEGTDVLLNRTFEESEAVFVMKRSKSGEKNVDVKPMIKKFEVSGDTVYITTVTGQEGSLKPELAFSGICSLASIESSLVSIHKTSMY